MISNISDTKKLFKLIGCLCGMMPKKIEFKSPIVGQVRKIRPFMIGTLGSKGAFYCHILTFRMHTFKFI